MGISFRTWKQNDRHSPNMNTRCLILIFSLMLLGIGAMPQNQDAADEPILTAKKGDDMRQLPEPPRVMEPLESSDSDERIDEEKEDVELTDDDERFDEEEEDERSDEGFDEEEDLTNEAKTFEDEERDEDEELAIEG